MELQTWFVVLLAVFSFFGLFVAVMAIPFLLGEFIDKRSGNYVRCKWCGGMGQVRKSVKLDDV